MSRRAPPPRRRPAASLNALATASTASPVSRAVARPSSPKLFCSSNRWRFLCADSVLALPELTPLNPRHIKVGTTRRVRKALPGTIQVTLERNPPQVTVYRGIRSAAAPFAIQASEVW